MQTKEIISSPNCGNSPKMEFISESVIDDIVWSIVGDNKIEGKEQFVEELNKTEAEKVSELVLDQILSHGKVGAANRTMKMQSGKKYAFSNFL